MNNAQQDFKKEHTNSQNYAYYTRRFYAMQLLKHYYGNVVIIIIRNDVCEIISSF